MRVLWRRWLLSAAGWLLPAWVLQGGGLLSISQLGLQSDFLAGFLLFHITTIIKTPINSSSSSPATTGMITAYSLGKKYWWMLWSLSMKGSTMIHSV